MNFKLGFQLFYVYNGIRHNYKTESLYCYKSFNYYCPFLPNPDSMTFQERSTLQYLFYLWEHPKQHKHISYDVYLCLASIQYFPSWMSIYVWPPSDIFQVNRGKNFPEIATLINLMRNPDDSECCLFNVGQCNE